MAGTRRRFSREFRNNIVKLAFDGKRPVSDLCKEFNLASSLVYSWLKQGKIDAGQGTKGELTRDERAELVVLRREMKAAKMESEFLKKVSRYFASHMP